MKALNNKLNKLRPAHGLPDFSTRPNESSFNVSPSVFQERAIRFEIKHEANEKEVLISMHFIMKDINKIMLAHAERADRFVLTLAEAAQLKHALKKTLALPEQFYRKLKLSDEGALIITYVSGNNGIYLFWQRADMDGACGVPLSKCCKKLIKAL